MLDLKQVAIKAEYFENCPLKLQFQLSPSLLSEPIIEAATRPAYCTAREDSMYIELKLLLKRLDCAGYLEFNLCVHF